MYMGHTLFVLLVLLLRHSITVLIILASLSFEGILAFLPLAGKTFSQFLVFCNFSIMCLNVPFKDCICLGFVAFFEFVDRCFLFIKKILSHLQRLPLPYYLSLFSHSQPLTKRSWNFLSLLFFWSLNFFLVLRVNTYSSNQSNIKQKKLALS